MAYAFRSDEQPAGRCSRPRHSTGAWLTLARAVCFAAGCQVGLVLSAQVSAETVAGVTPALQAVEADAGQPGSGGESHDSARECFVSPSDAARMVEDGGALVDVRDGEAFLRYRIPGSLNVPGYALKTKRFLKPSPVVLVNEGRSHRQLLKECRELRALGFTRVAVLEGGLRAWRAEVGPLQGEWLPQKDLYILEPRELAAALEERSWRIVDASGESSAALAGLPGAVRIPADLDPERFTQHLRRLVSQCAAKSGQAADLLIIDGAGEHLNTFASLVDRGELTGVLYLRGGARAYQAYLVMHESMWSRVARPPVNRSSCETQP